MQCCLELLAFKHETVLPRAACSAMAALTRLSLGIRYCFSFCRPLLNDEPRTYSRTLAGLSCMDVRQASTFYVLIHLSSLVMIGHGCQHCMSSRLERRLPCTRHADTSNILGNLHGQIDWSVHVCSACVMADCETCGELTGRRNI